VEDLDLKKLRRYASQKSFSNPYYRKVDKLIETIQESGLIEYVVESNHFYPKYLWQEEKELELYFLSDIHIIHYFYDKEGNVINKTRFKSDISNLELKVLQTGNKDVELYVTFRNGDIIYLTSNDSNEAWKYKFYNEILQIYKSLIS
jgi:hypothetical protein